MPCLEKIPKTKKVFPNDEALFKILYLNIVRISKKWKSKHNWDIAFNQLSVMFEDRLVIDPLN